MMFDQIFAIVLTAIIVVANIWVAVRAGYTALVLDSYCDWLCRQGTKHCGLIILIGIVVICSILAFLKTWSVIDIFIDFWHTMPVEYHIRSYAYMVENMGVAIIGWKMTDFIKTIASCKR
jgi:hypothetical protein